MSLVSKINKFRVKYFRKFYGPITDGIRDWKLRKHRTSDCNMISSLNPGIKRIFYLGITQQPNLGDMGQHYCIKKWIGENYPERELIMVESTTITDPRFTDSFFMSLRKVFQEDDIIVFQSGYCTQDLGGDHPLMHHLVCERMHDAKILMMPQTIYFREEENRRICAKNHNSARKMLFLARDQYSYKQAKEMFPDIRVETFPDIVTTLIGTLSYNNKRRGICLCTRNDGEKFYSSEEIAALKSRFQHDGIDVFEKDTQGKAHYTTIRSRLQSYIEGEIESYSYYEVTITDRYHGTIFSLCAGTPVIIIKTTDHKVTTGADWFKGQYDDYVYVAENLEEAYNIAKIIRSRNLNHDLKPYFKVQYYDKLKKMISEI